jgi:hypothetical protein
MSKLKRIISMIVVGGVAAVLWLQHSFNETLRRDNEGLRGVIAELKQSPDVHEPDASGESLNREELDELLKLRSEVTRLRAQTNELAALRQKNETLLATLKEQVKPVPPTIPGKKGPRDALPQDIHSVDTWAYRGYGRPEDTIESMHWAMMNGDRATFLGGMAPTLRSNMESHVSEEDFAERKHTLETSEFRILDRQIQSDNQMMMTVYFTRKDASGNIVGNSEDTIFQKIDGEWKVGDSAVTPPK